MTDNQSKKLVRVKYGKSILTLAFFLTDSLLFCHGWVGWWGKLRIKSISARLKLKFGLSLVTNLSYVFSGVIASFDIDI